MRPLSLRCRPMTPRKELPIKIATRTNKNKREFRITVELTSKHDVCIGEGGLLQPNNRKSCRVCQRGYRHRLPRNLRELVRFLGQGPGYDQDGVAGEGETF